MGHLSQKKKNPSVSHDCEARCHRLRYEQDENVREGDTEVDIWTYGVRSNRGPHKCAK